MARPKNLKSSTHLCLLLVTIFQAAAAISYSSYSSLCHFPVPSPDLHTTSNDSHSTATASNYLFLRETSNDLNLPRISTGHFSGGDDLLFAPERSYADRSFSFIPRHSALTTDPTVVRLVATLALEGSGVGSRRRESHHTVTLELEGYYSTAATSSAAELCMIGNGSYARDDGTGTDVLLSDVGLRLRLPRPSSLSQPFVTGRLEGAGFGAIILVAYADDSGDSGYTYAETTASCPPPVTPARDGQHVLTAGFSCSRLRGLLRGSYDLEYMPGRGRHAAGSSPLQLRHGIMHVNQMSCATDGRVRAYMAFYANQSDSFPTSLFIVGDEALVAEGFWDSSRSQLCLRACRVVRSGLSRADLAVGECGIGVSFWFPATWSFQHRNTVVGLIRNSSGTIDGDTVMVSGITSVLRRQGYRDTGDLSDIKYNYTLVEKAKEHHHSNPALSKDRNGSFPGNHSCRDFAFHFKLKKPEVSGYASPVTIGSTVVKGDRPMPDDLFYQRVAPEVNTQRLLNVSYDMEYTYWAADVKWRINAEGVYDTKTGSLCMVACLVGNGSSDCQVLVTVQFGHVETTEARAHLVGTISSLRTKSDPLFFEALEMESQGRMRQPESRIDIEIAMLQLSPALFAVVLILQLRHAKKHPEAVPAMSITMLAVLALGSLIPLMLDFEPSIEAMQNRFDPQWTWYRVEPHRFPLRAGTMLGFLLQLRLLQLALSRRRPTEPGHGGDGSSAAAERRTLLACLLLHFLGAVLMLIANRGDGLPRLLIDATEPTQADVLACYGGLVLDGFLLPQVIANAFSGAKARALSPWFYVGGTVIRAAPHAYDVYAGPRGNLAGGVALHVAVLFGMALLGVLLFLQQRIRLRDAFMCSSSKRRSGAYRMISSVSSC